MTQEQKDWYNYGRFKAAWLAIRKLEPGDERLLTQTLWDARKKAYRWLYRNVCEKCKHYTQGKKDVLCISCVNSDFKYECYDDNWEPID